MAKRTQVENIFSETTLVEMSQFIEKFNAHGAKLKSDFINDFDNGIHNEGFKVYRLLRSEIEAAGTSLKNNKIWSGTPFDGKALKDYRAFLSIEFSNRTEFRKLIEERHVTDWASALTTWKTANNNQAEPQTPPDAATWQSALDDVASKWVSDKVTLDDLSEYLLAKAEALDPVSLTAKKKAA